MSTPVADKVHPAQEAVLQVARDYADAWRTADAPLMARAIHPEFTKRWLSRSPAGTYLEEAGASRMVRWTADGGGKATHERDEVLFLHQHGSIAATKVMMSDRVEHLLLAEFDSQWKLFTVFSESRQWEERRDKSVAARHEAAINRVVMDYTEGYYTGNPARARAAFTQTCARRTLCVTLVATTWSSTLPAQSSLRPSPGAAQPGRRRTRGRKRGRRYLTATVTRRWSSWRRDGSTIRKSF